MILVHYSYRTPSFILLNLATRRERLISPPSAGTVHKWRLKIFYLPLSAYGTDLSNLPPLLQLILEQPPYFSVWMSSMDGPYRDSRALHPSTLNDGDSETRISLNNAPARCALLSKPATSISNNNTFGNVVWILGCVTLPPVWEVMNTGTLLI